MDSAKSIYLLTLLFGSLLCLPYLYFRLLPFFISLINNWLCKTLAPEIDGTKKSELKIKVNGFNSFELDLASLQKSKVGKKQFNHENKKKS